MQIEVTGLSEESDSRGTKKQLQMHEQVNLSVSVSLSQKLFGLVDLGAVTSDD